MWSLPVHHASNLHRMVGRNAFVTRLWKVRTLLPRRRGIFLILLRTRMPFEMVSSTWGRNKRLVSSQTPMYLSLFFGCTVVSEMVTVFVDTGAFDRGLK